MIFKNFLILLISSILSFYFSWISFQKLIPLFKRIFLDEPVSRSSHKESKPTGGGIIFASISSIFSSLNGFFIPLLSLPLAIVGLIDDKFNISSELRFGIQILTCTFLIFKIPLLESLSFTSLVLYIPIIIIFGAAIINFFNFIDGIDGLLISCITIASCALTFKNPQILPLSSSLLAFCFFNWPPASIFMGDAGSTFLGAVFFGLIIKNNDFFDFLKSILLITPILGDCIFCLFRRFIAGQNIFSAHKLHLYQRLHQGGWSHLQVSTLYATGVLILSLTYLTQSLFFCVCFSIIEIMIGFYLDKNYAKKFATNSN